MSAWLLVQWQFSMSWQYPKHNSEPKISLITASVCRYQYLHYARYWELIQTFWALECTWSCGSVHNVLIHFMTSVWFCVKVSFFNSFKMKSQLYSVILACTALEAILRFSSEMSCNPQKSILALSYEIPYFSNIEAEKCQFAILIWFHGQHYFPLTGFIAESLLGDLIRPQLLLQLESHDHHARIFWSIP